MNALHAGFCEKRTHVYASIAFCTVGLLASGPPARVQALANLVLTNVSGYGLTVLLCRLPSNLRPVRLMCHEVTPVFVATKAKVRQIIQAPHHVDAFHSKRVALFLARLQDFGFLSSSGVWIRGLQLSWQRGHACQEE